MPSVIYNSCLLDAFRGQLNFETDRFFVLLLTSDYVVSKSHSRRSDLTREVVGQGYKEGGAKASVAVYAGNEDTVEVSLGGARWTAATITARYAAYYRNNGGLASDDELIAVIDFIRDVTSTNGIFSLSESTLRIQN